MCRHANAPKERKSTRVKLRKEERVLDAKIGANMKKVARGMKHHCPVDHRPLSSPAAQLSCIGNHCLPCDKFHDTIPRIGNDELCEGCQMSLRQQTDRYKMITDLLKTLEMKTSGSPDSGDTMPDKISSGHNCKSTNASSGKRRVGPMKHKVTEQEIATVQQKLEGIISDGTRICQRIFTLCEFRANCSAISKYPDLKLIKALVTSQKPHVPISKDTPSNLKDSSSCADPGIWAAAVYTVLDVNVAKARARPASSKVFAELDAAIANDVENKHTEATNTELRELRFWTKISGKVRIQRLMAERRASRGK